MFGLLTIAGIPTATGVAVGIKSQSSDLSARSEGLGARKFTLHCYCTPNTSSARSLNNGLVGLWNSKLYVVPQHQKVDGHSFEGFFLTYPDADRPLARRQGLVSTISKEPPTLNWIYVDKETRELKYGNRTESKDHIVGPWNLVASDEDGPEGLMLDGNEAAVAIRTSEGAWEIRWEDQNRKASVADREMVKVSLEIIMLKPTKEGI